MHNIVQNPSENTLRSTARPILTLARPLLGPIAFKPGKTELAVPKASWYRIPHPNTGDKVFGYVPPLEHLTGVLDYLPIILEYGHHTDGENGMGAIHCWQRHRQDFEELGAKTFEDTALFVARVITDGTTLHYDQFRKDGIKLVACQPSTGTVLLGFSRWGIGPHWTVITAYGGCRYQGSPVGRIAAVKPNTRDCKHS